MKPNKFTVSCSFILLSSHFFLINPQYTDGKTSAPMSPTGRTSSTFYTHRTQTSTMFVKKSLRMQLNVLSALKEEDTCRFFSNFNYTPKETLLQDSLISMRNDFDWWKNNGKYGVFRDLAQYNFSIFSAHIYAYIIGLKSRLENITNNFPLG